MEPTGIKENRLAGADEVMYALHSETGEAKSKFKASEKLINSFSISLNERSIGVASKISQIIGLDSNIELVTIASDHICHAETRKLAFRGLGLEGRQISNTGTSVVTTPFAIVLICHFV
ncbi:uncharacterized protein LOC144561504 [Carex rostrata]